LYDIVEPAAVALHVTALYSKKLPGRYDAVLCARLMQRSSAK
jgi:hypothetical protein